MRSIKRHVPDGGEWGASSTTTTGHVFRMLAVIGNDNPFAKL
jgi:hypothetical protein